MLGWSIVGAFLGFLLGVFVTLQGGGAWMIAVTTVAGWAISYFTPLYLLEGAGRIGSLLYAPSGRSTPRKKEYSLAESYVVRGQYQAALDAFEEALLEDPSDPQPYLRIARISRDKLDDAEGAARWFRRALADARVPPGLELLVAKELLELYEVRMGTPAKAAPVLARMAEESEGTPPGTWARTELARIRSLITDGPDA